jgi:hypothetical protein
MINLIPPSAKRNLKVEYITRVISVWLIIAAIGLLIGASLLLPTYVLIGSQVDVFADSAAAASEKVNDFEQVSKTLIQSSRQAKMALDKAALPRISDYVSLFKNLEGSEITINQISVRRGEEGIQPVQINGVAVSREALGSFRDRLEAEPIVKSVEFPLSNLAQDRDIGFNLTIDIDNQVDI